MGAGVSDDSPWTAPSVPLPLVMRDDIVEDTQSRHRYVARRVWSLGERSILWVVSQPTPRFFEVQDLEKLARLEGYDQCTVVALHSRIQTSPRKLWAFRGDRGAIRALSTPSKVAPGSKAFYAMTLNARHVATELSRRHTTVAAVWGSHVLNHKPAEVFFRLTHELDYQVMCMGRTQYKHPMHYTQREKGPVSWQPL